MLFLSENSNYSSESLRNEGGAGLLFAYDSKGVYTPAELSVSGEVYTCPVCECKMHSVTLKSGQKIYARNPGQRHGDPICRSIERKKVEKSFLGLIPDVFISFLCRKPVPRVHPPTTDPDGPDDPQDTHTPPEPPQNEVEVKHASFSSLKQIADSGIYKLNPHDKQGDYYVSDYIITFRYAKNLFDDPNFQLGARILFAMADWIDHKTHSAIFSLFKKNDFVVKFRFIFNSMKDYIKVKEKFGTYAEDEMGKTTYKKNPHRTYLIASDSWQALDKSECREICPEKYRNCSICKGMYEAEYVVEKQLYNIPYEVE